jgi:MFS family permease
LSLSRIFYGWIIVASAFVVMFLGFGVAYAFASFFADLQQEFQASRGDISLIFSISGGLYFGLGAISGPIADRYGPRWVTFFGIVLIGFGLLLASQATALWQIYVTYGIAVGVGVGFSYVPAIGAVQPWFVRRRGFASGIAVSGIALATLLGPLCADWFIDLWGWRGAYVALAIITLIVGCSAAMLLEQSPAGRGLAPDGDAARPPAPDGQIHDIPGATIGQAVTSRPFIYMCVGVAFCAFGLFVPFVHLANYARDHGIDEDISILIFGFIGIGSLLGRFAIGGLADKWGRREAVAAMYAGLMIISLWWYASTSIWALSVYAVMFGVFYGGFVALSPALAADYFGGKAISSIIGLIYSTVAVGILAGPVVAGYVFDLTGTYEWVILASSGLFFAAALCAASLPKLKTWQAQASWFSNS